MANVWGRDGYDTGYASISWKMTMTPLRRSKTAPESLDEYDGKNVALTRTKTRYGDLALLGYSGLGQYELADHKPVSPPGGPYEREDPFNLAGFFPPPRFAGTPGDGEQWQWLRTEGYARQDETGSLYSETTSNFPSTPGSAVSTWLRDDAAEEAIKGEDKMGVLSLTGSEHIVIPGGKFIMRTFHPFSPPHVQMPDAAQLDTHLQHHQPTPKCESPGPSSPLQPNINAVMNPSSSSSNPISSQNTDQASSVQQQLKPPPSSPNGLAQHTLTPLTSAPPSVLSNPDPNASIQSILAANAKDKVLQQPELHHTWTLSPVPVPPPPPPQHTTPHLTTLVPQPSNSKNGKRKLDEVEQDDPNPKMRRTVRDQFSQDSPRVLPVTTVLCLHAAVAQKSYGSEKRFLCPPPVVHIQGPVWSMRTQQLGMSVVSEQGDRSTPQKTGFDNNMTGSFKFLHVTGTAKAKSFLLSLDIMDPPPSVSGDSSEATPGRVWATFDSAPVTIISKPSKKTAKTRNISSCILAGGPVSLFNRINSQTVRTKYMTVESNQLCASNSAWSAFNVNVVRRPDDVPPPHGGSQQPVTYGCEIVLSDTIANITISPPLIIRKVDKGRVSPEDGGPVSQMQKIALQRINPDGSRHYLSATGPIPPAPGVVAPSTPGVASQGGTHPLIFQAPRVREEVKDGVRTVSDEVDDYLCWTIVGISKFQYTFFDACGQNNSIPEMPITPFPTVFADPTYHPASNTLDLLVSYFFYDDPKTHSRQPLAVYLGGIGPLRVRIYPPGSGPLRNVGPFGGGVPGHPLDMPTTSDAGVAGPGTSAVGAPSPRSPTQTGIHTLVTVDIPPLPEVIKAIQEDRVLPNILVSDGAAPPHPSSSGADAGQVDGGVSNGLQVSTNPSLLAIASTPLPLLFVRMSDGVGYHTGRNIACENVFQSMDLGAMAAGHALSSPGGASADPNWLAAAQAAASAEGGLHGWTLRLI
ncbi:hypothetical protein ID866_4590 [Astraeus odoratus]|nr:hypothetical protein ID866_4590 [Astraeus odoratus]